MHILPRNAREQGAIFVTFAVSLLVLILMFGLAIDTGFFYMSKAALAKGVDASALMGVRTLGKGEAEAERIAASTFFMNYAASNLPARQVSDPNLKIRFFSDSNNNRRISVEAKVRVTPFFISILPPFDSVGISASAEAARAKLLIGLSLDRSGSMNGNGGAKALPGAVATFIDFFDDKNDQAAMTSYAYHSTVDVEMTKDFKKKIKEEAGKLNFTGWTYAHGGIDMANGEIQGVKVNPDENVLKTLVFFTDGFANAILSSVKCDPTKPARQLIITPGSGTSDFRNPKDGERVTCHSSVTTFFSEKYQQNRTRNSSNITEEGLFRAEKSAEQARKAGVIVFAIGLGNNIEKNSLLKMANDPSSPSYNPTQLAGAAVFAPTASDLDEVFRQVAAKILLRLTM